MSDQNPSAILREAKGIHATIKELLKTKEPFEKEIDFQRKNLRRRYLNLLLVHPYTKESDNVETHLWMQTSYSFISDYKQRLARIERATQRQPPGQSRHGPVEYRKLLQRFRQFLADEDKFWTQFVVRYHRSFSLDEAHPALVALGLVSEVADSPEELSPINGRNHFQFPPSTSFAPTSSSDRESRLTIVSKALVCLGDIARYREQYNESGGRSRVGPEEEGKGRKRNKRGGPPIADIPRPRNFERARTCYEQAKLLTPHDGNPSHQLAIIASYEKDMFTSLVHYYRSLCVKHPYETASENMAGLLSRTLEQRNTSGKKEVPPDIAHVPKVLIEEFKHKVVVLHALWRLGNESDDSTMVKEASNIYARFYDLVSERHLPEDFITRLVTLAQGALWKIRMLQDASSNNIKSRPRSFVASLPSPVIEARIYTHLLSLFRALLQVSIEKLKEPPPVDSDKDLAQRLIVEFRRTLPAMRIAGKWLRANYKYVMGDPEAQGNRKGKAKHTTESSGIISPLSTETIDFWRTYAEFLRALSRTFPQDRLPDLNFALTEDIEMKGFRPLKGYMDLQRNTNGTNGKEGLPLKESEVHPNDLHLMRIKDILSDAKALVEMENSPLAIYGNQFVVRGVESQVQPIPSMLPPTINQPVSPAFREQEDDAMTELTSNTDDAVIRDAFTHLNEGDDDDDDDEVDRIVWDPNPSAPPDPSPKLAPLTSTGIFGTSNSPVASTIPSSPPVGSVSPVAQAQPPLPSSSQSGSSRVDKTTAEDLLKGFMALGRVPELPKPDKATSDSRVAGSPFLFDRTGSSIWSASQDEQPLRFATSGPQAAHPLTPQTRHHNISVSQDFSLQHSIWSYPNNQNSHHLIGALPSAAPFTSHPTYPVTSHQRRPSATADVYPFPSARNPGLGSAGGASPHFAHQLDQSSVGIFPTPYPHAQPPPLETTSNSLYDPLGTPQHSPHTRHLPFHDAPAFASPAMPSISSIWANNG